MKKLLYNIQIRLMMLVSVVVLIVLIVSIALLYNYANNFIITRVAGITSVNLKNNRDNLDYFLNTAYDQGVRLQTDEDLLQLVYDVQLNYDEELIESIHNRLMYEESRFPYIGTFQIYLSKIKMVVTSDSIGYIHRGVEDNQLWELGNSPQTNGSDYLYKIINYHDLLSLFEYSYLSVERPLTYNGDLNVGSILVGIRDEVILEEFIGTLTGKDQESIYLFDRDYNMLLTDAMTTPTAELSERLKESDEFSEGYFFQKIGNNDSIVVYSNSNTAGYSMTYILPLDVITEGINNLFIIAGILILAAITCAVVILYFVLKTFIYPITVIKRSMKLFALGEFDTRINEIRKDEFSILYEGFNRMAEEVETLVDKTITQKIRIDRNQYRTLQTQISPHFIYNTLYSIKCMAMVEKNLVTSEMLTAFIELLHVSADNQRDLIPLGEELVLINHYTNLQKNRYGDSFEVKCEISKTIRGYLVPKLVLQPLVENSLKYGINLKDGKGIIELSAEVKENGLIIRVRDNGTEGDLKHINEILTEDSPFNQSEIGIINVNQRIKLIYGDEYGLSYEKDSEGTLIAKVYIGYEAANDYEKIK